VETEDSLYVQKITRDYISVSRRLRDMLLDQSKDLSELAQNLICSGI
jgi:hypothetical protein